MKIIGHRGAAGLALENTVSSLELASSLGVDAIEFDVHLTRDGRLVLCHDPDLGRVSSQAIRISDLTLKELREIRLNDGSSVPTLEEALRVTGNTPVIIELKDYGSIPELLRVLQQFPKKKVTVASFKHQEIAKLKEQRPDIKVYLTELTKTFEILQLVRESHADGMDLNVWLLNPLTYHWARRYNWDVMVFTVNSRLLAKFIGWLYPEVAICTNHPERFIKRKRRKKA